MQTQKTIINILLYDARVCTCVCMLLDVSALAATLSVDRGALCVGCQ